MSKLLIFFIGFSSIFAQSLLIREIVIAFYGNELAIGIIISSWLFGTGVASLLGGRLFNKSYVTKFIIGYFLFSTAILGEFILIKNLRHLLNLTAGELVSPMIILLVALFILLPFALINGLLFSLCIDLLSPKFKINSVGKVYAIDALGDMAGGLVFSFIFVFLTSSFINIYGLVFFNLLLLTLFIFHRHNRLRYWSLLVLLIYLLGGLLFLGKAEDYFLDIGWEEFNVVEVKSTPYGKLHLVQNDDYYSLFENGVLSFNFPDTRDAEAEIHLASLQVKNPQRILIVGEGAKGLVKEALKYNPEIIYYLELDPFLIPLLRKHLPASDIQALDDPRVKIVNQEARFFLSSYRGENFDLVIVNTPAPYTLYLNRFYSYEFFRKINSILSAKGVFTFELPSEEAYLNPQLLFLNASIYHTLKMTFNKVLLIPSSDNLRFITAKSDDYLTLSAARLFCRMQQQGINTQFFDLSYIQTLILPWHINYVKEKLEREQNVKINYDFKPISYYYSLRYLSSKFHSKINYLLKRVASVNFNFYQLLILVIWVALYLFRRKNVFSLYSFSMGGAGIGAVIFSIFGFQIVYGYVYHKIGLISAVFMLGVAISAYIASRKKIYHKLKWLIVLSLVNCLLFFLLPEIIENLFGLGYILQSIFFIFPLIVGILVGFAFTLANEYYLTKVPRKHRNRSFLYAFDLAGGSIIGFFLSFIAIPLYGLTDSSIIIGFMLLLSSGLMAAYSLKSNNS